MSMLSCRIAQCFHSGDPSRPIHAPQVGVIPYLLLSTDVSLLLQWWEKLLVNLTVLGVVLLILYGAFNQAVKVPAILSSIVM